MVRDQIVDEAGGNPLALLELTRMLTPEQRAGAFTPFAYALGVAEPPSDRVLSGFRERIRALSPSTRLCLLVAALEDTGDMAPVSRTLLALGHTMADFAPAERADLVRVTITGVEFRHPLVRTATRLTADIGQRMAAHAALAENVDDDRRVWHLAAIAVAPDAVVADELDRAAERARRRGGQIAVSSAYARAAELTPDPGVAVRRWAAASSAAWDAGIPCALRNSYSMRRPTMGRWRRRSPPSWPGCGRHSHSTPVAHSTPPGCSTKQYRRWTWLTAVSRQR